MYILPTPKKCDQKEGFFYIPYDGKIAIEYPCSKDIYCEAQFLQEQLKSIIGLELSITKSEKSGSAIILGIDSTLSKEQYLLCVEQKGASIMAGSAAGVLYGIQTFLQIVKQCGAKLSCIEIEDYPSISARGFYHDVTRSRIPTMEQLKKLANKCSEYKINQLQLYIEHSFLFTDFSEVWRDDTPLLADDILEFDQYCKKKHIELVPSIASFGHLYKVLRTKTYRGLGEFEEQADRPFSFHDRMAHHTLDITQEASFEMVKKMLEEFIPLFSSDKFNICADETFDLGKGKSKETAQEWGSQRMYVDFVARLCDFVISHGRVPMFWGDVIISTPQEMKNLPQKVICLNWDYGTKPNESNIKKLWEVGAHQYLCPGVHGWRHLINRFDAAYQNISQMCHYAHKYKADGVLNTDWGDYGHIHHPEFSIIGMIYGAEFSWDNEQLEEDELNRRISIVEYGDESGHLAEVVRHIAKQEVFTWEHFVSFAESCQYQIPEWNKEEIYRDKDFTGAAAANEELRAGIQELYALLHQAKEGKALIPFIIMAEGQILLNTAGAVIDQYRFGRDNAAAVKPEELAVSIENWTYHLKRLWLQTSQISEIQQVLNIFFWYADFLRSM